MFETMVKVVDQYDSKKSFDDMHELIEKITRELINKNVDHILEFRSKMDNLNETDRASVVNLLGYFNNLVALYADEVERKNGE